MMKRLSGKLVWLSLSLLLGCGGGGGGGVDPGDVVNATGTWMLLRWHETDTLNSRKNPAAVVLVTISQDGTKFTLTPPSGPPSSGRLEGRLYDWSQSRSTQNSLVTEVGHFRLNSEDFGTGTYHVTTTTQGLPTNVADGDLMLVRLKPAALDAGDRWTITTSGNFASPASWTREDSTSTVTLAQDGNDVSIDTGIGDPLLGYISGSRIIATNGSLLTATTNGSSNALVIDLDSANAGTGTQDWGTWTDNLVVHGGSQLSAERGEILGEYTLRGNYTDASWSGLAGVVVSTFFGSAVADGTGRLVYDGKGNNNTNVAPSLSNGPYSIEADGTFGYDSGRRRGGVSWDGNVLLTGSVKPGSPPAIEVFLRSRGVFDDTSFSGYYRFLGIRSSGGEPVVAEWGRIHADGAGTYTITERTENADGAITTSGEEAPAAYSIGETGRVTFDDAHLTGAMRAPLGVLVLGGGDTAGEPGRLLIVVPVRTAAGSADFEGDYWVVGIESDLANGGAFVSHTGSARVDGIGEIQYVSLVTNSEGTIATETRSTDYSIEPNGTVIASDVEGRQGGPYLTGSISADGRFVVLGGETAPDHSPVLEVFFQK